VLFNRKSKYNKYLEKLEREKREISFGKQEKRGRRKTKNLRKDR
jgi:hypothetical protein